jgi:hypothetical protein
MHDERMRRGTSLRGMGAPATKRALETPRVLKFDQQLIGVEMPPIDDRPHIVVVDQEQVGDR